MTDSTHQHADTQDPISFWEQRYAQSLNRQRGKAGKILQQMLAELRPGRALELGSSTGDDSLWLAERGWQVTGVDISDSAVQTAQRLAKEAGLADRIDFLSCDLATSFPSGQFELVCALYFQSPFDFPRDRILQQAAASLVPGGHILVVTHASAPPWSKPEHHKHVFPTIESERQDLALAEKDWEMLDCRLITRLAKGPEGQEAELTDNLIFARRL